MNEPITYPVGTGNVIGSHSAQDFVWAGRAEGSQEQATGETATHTPTDTNTPYDGPITEPIGSDVRFGAEAKRDINLPMLLGGFATIAGIYGITGIVLGFVWPAGVADLPWFLGGGIIRGVVNSWAKKDLANKMLMSLTYISLVYLGTTTYFATRDYRKTAAGRLTGI
jgi:hypothetical protein